MIDIETFGLTPTAEIRSIGACDIDQKAQNFYVNVSGRGVKYTRDEATVNWWKSQDVDTVAFLFENRKSPVEAAARLAQWLDDSGYDKDGDDEIWACGPQFDIICLEYMYRTEGVECPWDYRQVRDFRTRRAMFDGTFPVINAQPHHALADALHQAEHLKFIEAGDER
jgi:hypothetical protein